MQETKLHNVLIRGLGKSTLHHIRSMAKKNGRSVSKEIIHILQDVEIKSNIKSTEKIKP